MHRVIFTVTGFAGLLYAGCAIAADAPAPPRYDVATYCRNVGNTIGGSASIEQSCMQQEQTAYNGLKSAWATYPARAKSYCDMVARTIGGSYSIMASCIEMEVGAAKGAQPFKF